MNTEPSGTIHVLFVEDAPFEAELSLRQLQRNGLTCIAQRVETEDALRSALESFSADVILSDFNLPRFDGLSALRIAHEMAPEVPFIFVSGTIGEERAIGALREGAVDYVLKTNLARLGPAVKRALAEARLSRERQQQQQDQISRLNRVVRMLSGINGLVLRVNDRTELLGDTCRLAVSVGGYAAAIACIKLPGKPLMQPVGWSGDDEQLLDALRNQIKDSATRETSIVGRVVKSGEIFVCNDTTDLDATASFSVLLTTSGLASIVALPLVVDKSTIGVVLLAAHVTGAVCQEELSMLREVSGNLSFALQYMQKDITVRFLSHFDPLTGLAKRSLFCDRLARFAADGGSKPPRFTVFVFDIERLSVINDSFGRRTGDLLIQHVADRLKRRYPDTECLAHFMGGTFAIVRKTGDVPVNQLPQMAREQSADIFGEPFLIENRAIPVTVRAGFVIFPEDGADASILIQKAEAALHTAREAGEKQLHYDHVKHSRVVNQLALEHRLHLALERNEFELYYQPKVNVLTRRIQGVEALLRWRDPEAGLRSPSEFLFLLETTGLIVQVGDWVIQQAARDCRNWQASGLPPVRIAVNVSPLQLQLPGFVANLIKAVSPWANSVWGLDIEITEGTLLAESGAEVRKLQLLRQTGIKVAIDDFGMGYSSLSRLSTLPIDILKIDRSFISQAETTVGGILVKTIVALGHAFRMIIVAEGVETQEQLDILWHLGCDQSQGYLHSRPVTRDELTDMLQHGKGSLVLPPADA